MQLKPRPNIETASLQEIFDFVCQHMWLQNTPALVVDSVSRCMYRITLVIDGEEKPCSCAIGCLIPDSLYDEEIESHRVVHKNVLDHIAPNRREIPDWEVRKVFLNYLQVCHDQSAYVGGKDFYKSFLETIQQKFPQYFQPLFWGKILEQDPNLKLPVISDNHGLPEERVQKICTKFATSLLDRPRPN